MFGDRLQALAIAASLIIVCSVAAQAQVQERAKSGPKSRTSQSGKSTDTSAPSWVVACTEAKGGLLCRAAQSAFYRQGNRNIRVSAIMEIPTGSKKPNLVLQLPLGVSLPPGVSVKFGDQPAKAVAFQEALQPGFKSYQEQVLKNARLMAQVFMDRGYKVVSGGTDNHLFLVDLIDKGMTGKEADAALGRANITVNKNAVPNDPKSPFVTSGIRVGTPAVTTRGFGEAEVRELTGWMCDILDDLNNEDTIQRVKQDVLAICARFPVYQRT